jgi:transcriptional regulator with XRE-family HTH domain
MLPKAITKFQRDAGVSDYRLAMLSGIDKSTISRLKSGASSPTLYTLQRIARALGTKASAIVAECERLSDV